MGNVKSEFLMEIKNKQVRCAWVKLHEDSVCAESCLYELKPGFSDEDLKAFLQSLDFQYKITYTQHLFGYIWYVDGSWSEIEKAEYLGGCEEWKYRKIEDIPAHWLIDANSNERAEGLCN